MKNSKSKIKKTFLLVCMLWFAFCTLQCDGAFALNVTRTILPNGLTVLHSENHSLPVVMVTIIVKAGQFEEPKDKAGTANLVAELLTEGTKSRSSNSISEEIDFIGASLETSAGNDYITISLSVLKKDIHKGFELFSDILLNPTLPQEEMDRKRQQIKGLLRQREEDPSFLAERAFRKEVFGEHPYGRLIEGSPETMDQLKREDLVRFYSDYFLPNNTILSISGNLTPEELSSLIKQYLGEWKKVDFKPVGAATIEGLKEKKVVTIDRDLTQANIMVGHIGVSRDNPDYYALSIMNYILGGGGFSSRLMQSVRDSMGLAYDVHSFFAPYKKGGLFEIGLQTKNESANTALEEIFRQIERIRKEPVSDEELSEAKSYLTGSFPRRLDTNRKIADFLATVEFYDLGLDYVSKYPNYINSVTKEEVLRVAKKYINPENYVLIVVADQKKAVLK